MRILIAVPALLLLGACQVSKGNNETIVTFNQDEANNAVAGLSNTAENIANDIGSDVTNTGEKIQNKVGNTDVNVKIGKDEKTDNKTEKK